MAFRLMESHRSGFADFDVSHGLYESREEASNEARVRNAGNTSGYWWVQDEQEEEEPSSDSYW